MYIESNDEELELAGRRGVYHPRQRSESIAQDNSEILQARISQM
jgi:hypothetical protein